MTRLTRTQLDQQMEAIRLWRSGFTLQQTSHRMNVTSYWVEKWLTHWGVLKRCACCGIILEPYNPLDPEQRSWQNGTRNGTHCTQCESIVDAGGGWVGRLPLPSSEETANMNLGEVYGIGY